MLLSVVKRCPSCGKLVPIADMVGADGESQRCNACVSAAMVERGNKMHDAYLQSLMRTPRNELVAIGEQRTRAISRAILKRDEKRVKSEKNRARRAEMGLR